MRIITILTPIFIWSAIQAAGEPPATAAQPPDPILRAEAAVAQNLKTEAGKKYADTAAAAAAGRLGDALKACRDSLAAGAGKAATDSAGMDVYVMLSRRGFAKVLLVRPQGKMESCMIARLGSSLALPGPPDPNYWIKLRATQASTPAGNVKP